MAAKFTVTAFDAHSGGLYPRFSFIAILALLATFQVGGGALYASNVAPAQGIPQFYDGDDLEAMEWIQSNTSRDATILAGGFANEWIPFITERETLITPYGSEWESDYSTHQRLFSQLLDCSTATCVTNVRQEIEHDVDYLYFPKTSMVGDRRWDWTNLHRSLSESDDYTTVFENNGVVVYQVNT